MSPHKQCCVVGSNLSRHAALNRDNRPCLPACTGCSGSGEGSKPILMFSCGLAAEAEDRCRLCLRHFLCSLHFAKAFVKSFGLLRAFTINHWMSASTSSVLYISATCFLSLLRLGPPMALRIHVSIFWDRDVHCSFPFFRQGNLCFFLYFFFFF